jgi:hypothetical protein
MKSLDFSVVLVFLPWWLGTTDANAATVKHVVKQKCRIN